ncbi:hypothetical protein RRG08_050573 [Elysia crispata]|uniref:Uncharacterized protein n=1 Tax=Elysia crispata TaxID=231223 RepID=A0AAE0Z724_9GAST|nr:hypothetical protein RRG08_050573 [Elysia crispata]
MVALPNRISDITLNSNLRDETITLQGDVKFNFNIKRKRRRKQLVEYPGLKADTAKANPPELSEVLAVADDDSLWRLSLTGNWAQREQPCCQKVPFQFLDGSSFRYLNLKSTHTKVYLDQEI